MLCMLKFIVYYYIWFDEKKKKNYIEYLNSL